MSSNYDKEIREQVAQGATELEILGSWLRAYDRDEIDFEELMEKVSAYNAVFGTGYDVSPLEQQSGDGSEDAQAAKLFGMNEKENENKDEPTMEDEEL